MDNLSHILYKTLILILFSSVYQCRYYDIPGYCIFEEDPLGQIPLCPNYLFSKGEISIKQSLSHPEHKFTFCQNMYTTEFVSDDGDLSCYQVDGTLCTSEFPLGNYTSTFDFCSVNSCTMNSDCFCFPDTVYETKSCLENFASNTAEVFEVYFNANFSINTESILSLQTTLFVNHPSIIVKFKDRGFQFISNELRDYFVRITASDHIIHLNLQQRSFYEFEFPPSFDHQAFGYRLEILNNNVTYFSGVNETRTTSFCDEPSCVFCEKAYQHFNCLSTERQVLFLFCFLSILLLSVLVIGILIYSLYLLRKPLLSCLKYSKTSVSSMPITSTISNGCNSVWCRLKSCFTPDPQVIKSFDTENDVDTRSFDKYLQTKYEVPLELQNRQEISTYLIQKKKKTLSSIRKEYRVSYPKGFMPVFLALICLFCIVNACNSGVTINALVNNCVSVNSTHEECNTQFSNTVSIDRVFNLYCGTIMSNNVPIGTIRIGYISASTKLNYNLLYYTSGWTNTQQSNFRCQNARGSYCDTQHCLAVNRTGFGNLDDYYLPLTYGVTYCDFVPAAGSLCIFQEDGCLFSGWGVLPLPNTINSVYRYNNFNPVEVELFIEVTTDNIVSSNIITLSNAQTLVLDQTFGFPGTTEISLDLSPVYQPPSIVEKVSYPSGFIGPSINDLGTFLPNKVGDIQSNSPASFSDEQHYSTIVTQPSAILSSKQIINHGVQYNFFTSGLDYPPNENSKLPYSISEVDYSLVETGSTHYNNFNGVKANLTNPGPIIITMISQFSFTRRVSPCTFEINVIGVQGCCSCNTNAYLEVSISYDDSHCLINFFSRDVNILTVTNVYEDRIYFSTTDCSQNIHISAESSGFSQNIEYYISLEEPVVQSFSNGITTIEQYETSYDIDGTSFDLIHAPNFFKDFFNKNNMLRNIFIVFVVILVSLCLLYFLYRCALSILCSMNPYKKVV